MRFMLALACLAALGCGGPDDPGLYHPPLTLVEDPVSGGEYETLASQVGKAGVISDSDSVVGVVAGFNRGPQKEVFLGYMVNYATVVTSDRKAYRIIMYDKDRRIEEFWALNLKGFQDPDGKYTSGNLVVAFKKEIGGRKWYSASEVVPLGHLKHGRFIPLK